MRDAKAKGAMVKAAAEQFGRPNMVAPGWMADEKVDTASQALRNFAATISLRRHGNADESGNACAFFLSDLAGYAPGAFLPVTGGRITQISL